jgi:hypothetical protein
MYSCCTQSVLQAVCYNAVQMPQFTTWKYTCERWPCTSLAGATRCRCARKHIAAGAVLLAVGSGQVASCCTPIQLASCSATVQHTSGTALLQMMHDRCSAVCCHILLRGVCLLHSLGRRSAIGKLLHMLVIISSCDD